MPYGAMGKKISYTLINSTASYWTPPHTHPSAESANTPSKGHDPIPAQVSRSSTFVLLAMQLSSRIHTNYSACGQGRVPGSESSQVLTPQSCKEQGARIKKEGGMPRNISLASCPSGRRTGWVVRRFDSLVLNEVPDVVLCLCAQGEGAFLRIAP